MAFVARKPFLHNGVHYRPGDVVQGFPENFFRSEGLIRTGFIVERGSAPAIVEKAAASPTVTKKRGRPSKAAKVVEVDIVEEESVEEVVE